MPVNSRKSDRPIDPSLAKVINKLHLHAKTHPKALSVKVALDAILGGLIQEALGGRTIRGEATRIIRTLKRLATLFPDNPLPFRHLSKVCIDMGDHKKALNYAESGLSAHPDDPDLVFNRALCLLQLNKPEAAIAEFRRYIKHTPTNPWAYNNAGNAFRTLHLFAQAEHFFKLAIEHDNRFIPAYHNLALLAMDQKDWATCVRYALIAEKHGPADREMQLALGDGYMGLKEYQSALQHLVEATLIDRDFVEAYETMSATYVELGMYALSIAAAQEALKRNPHSWMALANIGYSYSKQKRYEDAIKPQLEALQYSPNQEGRYKLCWELGWNYLQTGRYSRALDYTEQAIKMKSDPDIILSFNKGLILLVQGKTTKATVVYEQAIAHAGALEDKKALREGIQDIKEFMAKKGLHIDRTSPLFKLLKSIQPLAT